jgi:hypothetical protein
MGKDTGFLEIPREQPTRRSVEERVHDWFEIYQPFPKRSSAIRARDAWIAACLSATPAARSTISSPTGTISSTTVAGNLPCAVCMRPITFPSSRAHLPGAVRSIVRTGYHSAGGFDQADRAFALWSAVGTRAGFIPSRRSTTPASGWQWWAVGLRAWRQRSSCAAPDIGDRLRKTRPHRRLAALWHSRTSSWKSMSSIAVSNRCAPKALPS